ncbi:MAG: exodeoxyribonuclease V subunit gamma, partial [Thiolinea sp.]
MLRLAQAQGIAANLRYLFPAELTWEMLRAVLDNVPERDPCSPRLLRWRLLQEFLQHAERYQQSLGHYLQAGQDESAWQLAQQLATVFDGYLFFRPDWVQAWESQPAQGWQDALWRTVITEPQLDNWIRLQARFMQQLPSTPQEQLPARISFFSVPALSPAYIELVAKIAERVEVNVFVMNPSMQYWGDIESEKRRIKFAPDEQVYVAVGNPLLASWGTQGRDFIENLRNVEPYPAETEAFSTPDADTLLQVVQADILNLQGAGSLAEVEDLR